MRIIKLVLLLLSILISLVVTPLTDATPVIEETIVEQEISPATPTGVPAFLLSDVVVCSSNSAKTYMDYSKTSPTSRQGKFMAENMQIKDGLLYDEYGFIGVALGSYFGAIGARYIFKLDTGIELKLIKVEEKSDRHTYNGCQHKLDGSVIEFVIDSVTNKFKVGSNGYIANGNYNNLPQFKGKIVKILKVN